MDEEIAASSRKTSTRRQRSDDEDRRRSSYSIHQQSTCSSSGRQPAQERLKRLQTNLKHSSARRHERERLSPRRSSRHAPTAPRQEQQQQQLQHRLQRSLTPPPRQLRVTPESPKYYRSPDKTKTAQYLEPHAPSTSSRRRPSDRLALPGSAYVMELKSAWAKPKALLDASNRLDSSRSNSANQRLTLLRESLQQRQQEQKRLGDNNNNNATPVSSRKMATRSLKTTPHSAQVEDDVEPMDIDGLEREAESSKQAAAKLNESQAESMEEDLSDITVLRLLSTGLDLPARREDHMYFVLDTNVLLDNLVFVEDLCHLALHNTSGSMLYIPYVVIRELDSLKDRRQNNELKRPAAVRAIRYLNNKFDHSLSIQAQSAKEEVEHLIEVECADDSIVNCCLQLQAQVPHLMLLTNDAVLRIKAKSSAIEVSCRSDLMRDYREQFDALPAS
ncbi:hypothetical protein KR222_002996 [Zaprionus bogoriensis]|nr:hypothetical protein KR222_002996 [Zaprionus bogoriensis]